MDKKVAALLNDQVNKEFYSAYLYLDMANFYSSKGLGGFANWFEIQAKEEQFHAIKIYKYLHENGEEVTLEAIDKPALTYTELIDPLRAAYAHEQYVTSLINTIYAAAQEVNDYRTTLFLAWFITEQGEEEETSGGLVSRMELFGDDKYSLYLFDSEMAARTYIEPGSAD